ncbi:YhgE/Pip domain-containing protein [Robertmurraya massiliosenegalensis]|uniref:YhgE/Pip domain-containing protein n=1 Tax=Robertmurraya massiliosenegalensis TaxID=1287657 RepID=UPI0002EBE45A|nr:YhgE/Pip domain-containing protein [Robertmurraya massiliosenegalensis]
MRNLMKAELSSLFKNKKLLIPVIAILFIPILYSGMFLWAFWDPYEHLADLPVAIVNEDTGAIYGEKDLKLGEELVDKLKDSEEFKFDFLGKEVAYKGLEKQDYYLLVEIPADFSTNATTLMDDDPQKLELKYVPNESYNFLAAQIGGTAIEKIKASISEKITETYAETVFSSIDELASGLEQASDGAGKIYDGSVELKNGTNELYTHLAELASKSITFNEGMKSADSGSAELSTGIQSLNKGLGELEKGHTTLSTASEELTAGNKELAKGISEAKAGIAEMDQKLPELTTGTKQLASGAENLSGSLDAWKTEAETVSGGMMLLQQNLEGVISMMDPTQQKELEGLLNKLTVGTSELAAAAGQISTGAGDLSSNLNLLTEKQTELQAGVHKLAEGSNALEEGATKLVEGHEQFQSGMDTFAQKFSEAKVGANQLADGASTLSGGLHELSAGTDKITTGAGQLEEGAKELADGTLELSDGSDELAGKLTEGALEASSVNANDKTFNMMANPVEIQDEKINEVPNYGTGFAPYFLSLGLFVGALLLSIVFPLREPAAVPKNAWSWFTSKFAILSGIGIIQGLIAAAVLMGALGLEVKNIPLFLLFVIVTSLTFVALIQFFVTAFGDPGRFIAILILIFQLTTSAGTFPLELIPGFLQHFNAFLPMTYTVQGLKAVISSGDYAFMWQNLFVLIGFMMLFIVGSLGYFRFKHKRQFEILTKAE